jgi:hypothetical protein
LRIQLLLTDCTLILLHQRLSDDKIFAIVFEGLS